MKELDYMVTRTYPGDGGPPNTQIVPRPKNFVAALPNAPVAKRQPELTPVEGEILISGQQMAGNLAKESHSSHIRQTDDALTHAQASLLYSQSYMKVFAIVTGALLAIIYIARGGDLMVYFFGWLIAWGIVALIILAVNRWQGLRHSSSGVAHAQIKATKDVAIFAIDRHCTMLERKWGIEIDAERNEITVGRD